MTFQPEQRVKIVNCKQRGLNGMLGTIRAWSPMSAISVYNIDVQLDGQDFNTPFAETELEPLSTEEWPGLHLYEIYYEEADGDAPKRFLGTLRANTQSEALERGTLRYGYPDHDLLARDIAINVVKEE